MSCSPKSSSPKCSKDSGLSLLAAWPKELLVSPILIGNSLRDDTVWITYLEASCAKRGKPLGADSWKGSFSIYALGFGKLISATLRKSVRKSPSSSKRSDLTCIFRENVWLASISPEYNRSKFWVSLPHAHDDGSTLFIV